MSALVIADCDDLAQSTPFLSLPGDPITAQNPGNAPSPGAPDSPAEPPTPQPGEFLESQAKPLAIDLFCGLGGWTEGLLAEGYYVVGFDIERHTYGEQKYPAQLVIQDVLSLHGSQFKDAALIVASPPCQEFSYMAMPWSLAKAKRAKIKADPAEQKRLTGLFDACFRIQREACQAAGHHIPMVVENVRGATEWVGRARWNYGSFYLWGDVPALMPLTFKGQKVPGFRFDGSGRSFQTASVEIGIKGSDGYGRDHPAAFGWANLRTSSHSKARKAASAMIAKIPLPLSRHVAKTFYPTPQPSGPTPRVPGRSSLAGGGLPSPPSSAASILFKAAE